MKILDILEQTIGYTPERINELIQESSLFYNKAKKYYEKSYNMVLLLTIQDCINEYEMFMSRLKDFNKVKNVIEDRYGKYYDIVDSYNVSDNTENVISLEKNVDDLDKLLMEMSEVINAMESLLESAKYMSKITH